jgi:hypothetical protein
MRSTVSAIVVSLVALLPGSARAQSTTGTILGAVVDEGGGVLPGTVITVRNTETNVHRSLVASADGRFRASHLPPGVYELTFERRGFARLVRSGVDLSVDEEATLDVVLRPAALTETVTVDADSPVLDVASAEVGVRFDHRRVTELPISPDRNLFTLALSAPGVTQLGTGHQISVLTGASTAAVPTQYAVNGMRPRSNGFLIDGQAVNDPFVSGVEQPINNPDLVQEIRLVTNQFGAQYGRNSGSVLNVVTKSGTNDFHGTAFWFENRCGRRDGTSGGLCMNARTNLDEAADRQAGRDRDRFRREHQYGGTLGGPVLRDRTFFFASLQRWTNDELASGQSLSGVPTAAGRSMLETAAGAEPQVRALLDFLPAASASNGRLAPFTRNGVTYQVPLGTLTGESAVEFRNHQASLRLDHHFGAGHSAAARYLYSSTQQVGIDQISPPGFASSRPQKQQAAAAWLTTILGSEAVNEVKIALDRADIKNLGADPRAAEIPNLEVTELGLLGFLAGPTRTALGLASNLPVDRLNSTVQLSDTFSWSRGRHTWKAGAEVHRNALDLYFIPFRRGALRYVSLQRLVDDVAEVAQIARTLPGVDEIQHYRWRDAFLFLQDDWRVRDDLVLNVGLRYERPGNVMNDLYDISDTIVSNAGGDQRYALTPQPGPDRNNLEPRLGFSWNPRVDSGPFAVLTGSNRLVVRGGYARTHDYSFVNYAVNVAGAFPFVALVTLPTSAQPSGAVGISDAWDRMQSAQAGGDPLLQSRTTVADDLRAAAADQWSLEVQRQLGENFVIRAGYVATRGRGLFQTLDGNPRLPFSTTRVDPTRGVIRVRANAAHSTYDSLQVSAEKRLSRGVSASVYYTLSRFIDTASDIFNISLNDFSVAQDSFDIAADRARSSYDRPQRLTGNLVVDLPFHRDQRGLIGRLAGGWRVTATFNLQDGVPFTVLNGSDPTGALSGIDALAGRAIRPNLNTDLDLDNMTIQQVLDAGGRSLFRALCGNPSPTCAGERVGDAPRNGLRSDGVANLDLAFIKNVRLRRDQQLQLWVQLFNATNTRNFGIPDASITSANFLNEKATNGGARKIVAALRFVF